MPALARTEARTQPCSRKQVGASGRLRLPISFVVGDDRKVVMTSPATSPVQYPHTFLRQRENPANARILVRAGDRTLTGDPLFTRQRALPTHCSSRLNKPAST